MASEPVHYLSLMEVSAKLRRGDLKPTALTEMILTRIARRDGTLGSYTTLLADRAMAMARAAADELNRGLWRGPLHGVPIAVKDLCYTDFAPTAAGMFIHKNFMPPYTSTVVERLERVGAILLGKLSMTEGAFATHHPSMPTPVNPWHADVWTGASSSGSGAATAAGLCYGSLGSDTGGSIRFPSSGCGLTGLKPTWGRVSRYGVCPLSESLDHIGPMTRTAADCAAILAAIAGADPRDTDPMTAWVHLCLAESAIAHEATYPSRASEYGPGLSGVLRTAGKITPAELGKAHILRDRFTGQVADVFRDIDVLLIPVMAAPTPSTAEWDEMAKGDLAPVLRYTAPFNSTGMPALTMNGGFDKRGAPIGFQLVGEHLSEDLLLRAGYSFQSVTDWHTRHPALD